MTGPRAATRVLSWTLAVLLLGGCLSGCVTVNGRGSAASRVPSSDSLGLASPFLPLPSVSLAPVPDSYDPYADAPDDVARALAAARRDGRPVLIDFGSAWCDDCRAMSRLVDTPGVHQVLARNYHTVTVDVGHYDHNMGLAGRYVDLEASGIPALVELAPDGSLRQTDNEERFSDARDLSPDQLADTLIDWLYAGPDAPDPADPAGTDPITPAPVTPAPTAPAPTATVPAVPKPPATAPISPAPAVPKPPATAPAVATSAVATPTAPKPATPAPATHLPAGPAPAAHLPAGPASLRPAPAAPASAAPVVSRPAAFAPR